ncbi:MAG: ATP-binding protein [Oscillospiraceae bacterium]|nr:ATP-binding protein [Oscillospiraceae bacterium]
MEAFTEKLLQGPRIVAVTGHFGSGKTEFCVSLAFALAARGTGERLALADLDIENPFFRSRERQDALAAAGVRVYSDPFNGRNGSELQVISAAVRAPLEDEGCRVLLDCGGDAPGARILNQFGKYFRPGAYQLLCVVNPYRPGSDTVDKAVEHIRSIERATALQVTGLIANGHLIRSTTPEEVAHGWAFTQEVSAAAGVEALCACCMTPLAETVAARGIPVFPIGMYMRETYLDKRV